MTALIDQQLQTFRAQIDEIVKDLHDLTIHIGNEDLAQTVSDLRNRLHEPFMFVIVGEVKSGKSSFINALLDTGKEVTRVAPQPMTDTIQQILYGDKEETITLNPYLKKILLPVDILQEIAIVDTPGTNTIIEHHQQITESFIPASDLIVFVFEAKNPYRQSAWDFFNFLHADWHRKVIFVLQQKDLLSREDLEVNLEGVRQQARKKGIDKPTVFAVSAKEELEGKKEQSGFQKVRAYIKENITGGKAPFLKLQNNILTSLNILDRIWQGLQDRKAQWEADVEFRRDIRQTLDEQQKRSDKQVDMLVENLLAAYDRITSAKEAELSSGLSFFSLLRRSIASVFSKKSSPGEWLDNLAGELEQELNDGLKNKLDEGVVDLAESIQQMVRMIDLKIRNSKTILRNDHELFSDIAERRSSVLAELRETFSRFLARSENFTDKELFPDRQSISPNIATGSGLAVVGLILAGVTQGMVFDITGGVLTTIGLLFAGFTTRSKRKKIIGGFRKEVANGREKMETEVSDKLKSYIEHLKNRINAHFEKFDQLIEQESGQIEKLEKHYESVQMRLVNMRESLPETGEEE